MKTLHWHTDDNPCLLRGVPVTPESWVGGVVQIHTTGAWATGTGWGAGLWGDERPYLHLRSISASHPMTMFCGPDERPIFPPKGWAGKTDVDLWADVMQGNPATLLQADDDSYFLTIEVTGLVALYVPYNDGTAYPDPAALILALERAEVLATRLKEAQHGTR